MHCTGCSKEDTISELAERSAIKPLVVVTPVSPKEIPAGLFGNPQNLLIISDPSGDVLPADMFTYLPQAVRVLSNGTIVEIPRDSQSLSDFVVGGNRA
jgi:hypothetical protein